jgi:tRNA-specific 2-thiouridylase
MSSLSKKTVVVAMSGGVDSSVAALLLKQQGYDLIGVSMKTHETPESSCETEGDQKPARLPAKTCCTASDIQDARRVCQMLDIPFYPLDFQEEFATKVIDYFGKEYSQGRTPNPCVACNNHLKFSELLKYANKMGAYYLATGHYARKVRDDEGHYHLMKSKDRAKDQTYFLFGLHQESLEHILFPLGDLEKSEVRELARQAGFSTAEKPESQEICFVPDGDYAKFIENHLPSYSGAKGDFVDEEGKVLGEHRGIHAYTIGQRRGLGIATGDRIYVTDIVHGEEKVVLGPKESLMRRGLKANHVSWIHHGRAREGMPVEVKIRHRERTLPGILRIENETNIRIDFNVPEGPVTPGQAVVVYNGEEVLGGGFIEKGIE